MQDDPGQPDYSDLIESIRPSTSPNRNAASTGEREPSSWSPVDLTDALAGNDIPPPKIWHRSDGTPLIYAGRVHWFQGESESCKSWAAQAVAVTEINDGNDVLYIDFEDDDRGVISRLLALGATTDAIASHFVYIRPDEALRDRQGRFTDGWLDFAATLDSRTWRLAVIDGVTEAMTIEGLELISNADIAAWMRLLPKRIAARGAAVVSVDHVTKAIEGRGRYAIGGQHKLAGVTGAAYLFTVIRPLARATTSEPVEAAISVFVTKDRPGYVRGRSPEGKVGTLALTAWPDRTVNAVLDPIGQRDTADLTTVRHILEYLTDYDGASANAIERNIEGGATKIREMLRWSKDHGYIRIEKEGNTHRHYLTADGRDEVTG